MPSVDRLEELRWIDEVWAKPEIQLARYFGNLWAQPQVRQDVPLR